MRGRAGGAIGNISSIAGIRHTGVDYVTYATTKGALIPFSRAIALQYARQGIRSNCILPGLMNTPLIFAGLPEAYAGGDAEAMVKLRHAQCPTARLGAAWGVEIGRASCRERVCQNE